MSFRKDLNKVPAAACWDYEEIPLSVLVQACLREGERERIARMPSADLGITKESSSLLPRPSLLERMSFRKDLPRMPVADCGDYAEIPLSESRRQTVGITQKSPKGKKECSSEVGIIESPLKN